MSDLEKEILKAFYEYNKKLRSKPNKDDFDLKHKGERSKHEFAHYLVKLRKEGYLSFDESKTIIIGGLRDEEYLNSVAYIITEKIETTGKVDELFEKRSSKVNKNLKLEARDFGRKVKNEVSNYFAKGVAGVIILIIFMLLARFLYFIKWTKQII